MGFWKDFAIGLFIPGYHLKTVVKTKSGRTIYNGLRATDPTLRLIDGISSMSLSEARKRLNKGDHIACNRTVYSHHGIYDGRGYVYEYNEGKIRRSTLTKFSDGDNILIIDSNCCYTPDEVIQNARSRLHEKDYDLVFNNCEHFARWCRDKDSFYDFL